MFRNWDNSAIPTKTKPDSTESAGQGVESRFLSKELCEVSVIYTGIMHAYVDSTIQPSIRTSSWLIPGLLINHHEPETSTLMAELEALPVDVLDRTPRLVAQQRT
jgi:hypothetical protein